jgi:hypothetical protein
LAPAAPAAVHSEGGKYHPFVYDLNGNGGTQETCQFLLLEYLHVHHLDHVQHFSWNIESILHKKVGVILWLIEGKLVGRQFGFA